MHIIDRRLNPSGKSLENRQRMLRRARGTIEKAVRDSSKGRDVTDILTGGEVSIALDGISEPRLRRGRLGIHDRVLPGNDQFSTGDVIPRPPSGGGSGGNGAGAGDDKGEDSFRFILSQEEYVNFLMSDLALPDMNKRKAVDVDHVGIRRAGFSMSGSPANLSVPRTSRMALSRRIALGRPSARDVEELEEEIRNSDGADPSALEALQVKLTLMHARMRRIPYIDTIDTRYRRFEVFHKPSAQAVMFCMMDVSGSMSEHKKDLAKRFYMLLYIFLKRQYDHVDVVFVRHTTEAEEVDEKTFFYDNQSGGTIVSTAIEVMKKTIKDRYSPNDWNIYGAQASDGDNVDSDNPETIRLLNQVLPDVQYFAYLEVDEESQGWSSRGGSRSNLWEAYETLNKGANKVAMRKVRHRHEIFPVFRDLFKKDQSAVTEEKAAA